MYFCVVAPCFSFSLPVGGQVPIKYKIIFEARAFFLFFLKLQIYRMIIKKSITNNK